MEKNKRVSNALSRPLKDATIVASSTVERLTWGNTKLFALIRFILLLYTRDLKKRLNKLESLPLIFWLRLREKVSALKIYSLTTSTMGKLERLCLGFKLTLQSNSMSTRMIKINMMEGTLQSTSNTSI
jgi:hypothetical protein